MLLYGLPNSHQPENDPSDSLQIRSQTSARNQTRNLLHHLCHKRTQVCITDILEMPLANLFGHGDVKIHKAAEFVAMAEKAGFTVLTIEKQKGFRAHLVARK